MEIQIPESSQASTNSWLKSEDAVYPLYFSDNIALDRSQSITCDHAVGETDLSHEFNLRMINMTSDLQEQNQQLGFKEQTPRSRRDKPAHYCWRTFASTFLHNVSCASWPAGISAISLCHLSAKHLSSASCEEDI